MNFKYLSLVFLCLLVLGSVSYISAGVHNITLGAKGLGGNASPPYIGTNCEGMNWIFENQTIKSAEDIQTILEQYNCIEEQNAQESALKKYNIENKIFLVVEDTKKLHFEKQKLNDTRIKLKAVEFNYTFGTNNKLKDGKLLDAGIIDLTKTAVVNPSISFKYKEGQLKIKVEGNKSDVIIGDIYYLEEENYSIFEQIYEYNTTEKENCYASNTTKDATICEKHNETAEVQVGTKEITKTREVKKYDYWNKLIEENEDTIFYSDIRKTTPTDSFEVYFETLGYNDKEHSLWGETPYYQILNTTMQYGALDISSTLTDYVALVKLDTSNSTVFNTTDKVGLGFTDINNNSTRLYAEVDSGWGTSETYIWVGNIDQTSTSQIVAWADNNSFEVVDYNASGMWRTANYVGVWHGNENATLIDSAGYNNLTRNSTSCYSNSSNKLYVGSSLYSADPAVCWEKTGGITGFPIGSGSSTETGWYDYFGSTLPNAPATTYGTAGSTNQVRGLDYENSGNMRYWFWGNDWSVRTTIYGKSFIMTGFDGTNRYFSYNLTKYSQATTSNVQPTQMSIGGASGISDGYEGYIDEYRVRNESSTDDWVKAEYALIYNDTGIWNETIIQTLTPSILNSTNGTYFTVSNDLYGWIANSLDGLSNVSYTWWNGSTAYSSGTAINVTGNSTGISHNIANISASLLNVDDVWILQINGTNGTTNVSDTNSSSITITNTAPIFTNVSFTANGSSYQLGPVQLNFSAQDLDAGNLTYFVNWFLNGTNISAYAQTGSMLSGTTVRITPPVSVYNVSDNWYARVWVTDGSDTTPYNNTHNTTIQNYFSSVVAYAPNATSHIYTQAYINFTVNGAQNASARFTLGAQNVSMTNSGTGNNYEFYNTTIVPPAASEPTNYEGVWYYRAILANGSYYELTTNQSVNVGTNGFFICNATINTTAIEYTMLDSFTLLPVNASVSLLTEWLGDDGSTITKSLTDINETVYICVTPSTFNRQATISESISATGYLPATTSRASQNYSSDVTQRTIYLTNSSSGSIYTFQTLNQFGGPVSGATVKIMQGSTTIFIGITDETGSALAPLTELNIYQVIASATGYSNSSFNFIAGATTTIPITLVSTSASNITAPNYQEVFNEVQFTIAPTTRFFSSPTNITYTISSPNSTLWSWGFFITSNGTVVNTQTSTTTTGGSLYYTVNQTGTYILNIWFKADGFANYTPPSYFFTYGNTSGVSTASENLQTGSIISGFGFYLLAVIFAMMGALWVSQYSPEGAAIVGLLILCAFTFMWSDAIVLQTGVDELGQPTGITSLMATGFVLLTTLSAFYLRQYGA